MYICIYHNLKFEIFSKCYCSEPKKMKRKFTQKKNKNFEAERIENRKLREGETKREKTYNRQSPSPQSTMVKLGFLFLEEWFLFVIGSNLSLARVVQNNLMSPLGPYNKNNGFKSAQNKSG